MVVVKEEEKVVQPQTQLLMLVDVVLELLEHLPEYQVLKHLKLEFQEVMVLVLMEG